ncbi:MAG: M1 family metallopeptidase [bacterium]|nr:M1 family metallopeptidase [bacterium]
MNAFRHPVTLLAVVLLTVGAAACNFQPIPPTPPETPTTVRVALAQGSPVPTLDMSGNRVLQSVSTQAAADPPAITAQVTDSSAAPTETIESICAGSGAALPIAHQVTGVVDYAAKRVDVAHTITLYNRTSSAFADLVVNLEPNRYANVVTMGDVRVEMLDPNLNLRAEAYELTGRRLLIDLNEPLPPGCGVTIQLGYALAVQPVGAGLNALTGYFGYTMRQMNLGHWLATMAVRRGDRWVSHDAISIGEQIVADAADWDVTLQVNNAPPNLTVAAPGTVTRPDGNTWRFILPHARELAISLSDQFNVTLQDAADGTIIELYSFRDSLSQTDNGAVDGAGHALLAAGRSLAMYSDLFGPYPYARLAVVEGDFADGMEFTGLVFVGRDWFRGYTGDPGSYLTIITVHEVAHQWWYARVGNDQALTPWLDEALATYSEYIFFEEYYPELRDWWWSFRVDSFVRSQADYIAAPVDSPVYTFLTVRQYINAVYLRGARMLHALRDDLGTDPFFDWLRRYAEAGSDRVVGPDVFWTLLTPEQLELTRETRQTYLSDVDY